MKKNVTAIIVIFLSLFGALVTASETDSNVEKGTKETNDHTSSENGRNTGGGGGVVKSK